MSTYDFSRVPPVSESENFKDLIKLSLDSYTEFKNSSLYNKTVWFRAKRDDLQRDTIATLGDQFNWFLFYMSDYADGIGIGRQGFQKTPTTLEEVNYGLPAMPRTAERLRNFNGLNLSKSRKVEILKGIFENPKSEVTTVVAPNSVVYSYYRIIGAGTPLILPANNHLRQFIYNWSVTNRNTYSASGNSYEALPIQNDDLVSTGKLRVDYEIPARELFRNCMEI